MNPQRLNAVKQGLTTFEPGQPCKHGHDSPRYTRSGQCVTCSKETSRKAYQEMIALAPEPAPQQTAKERKAIALSVRQLDCQRCTHKWTPRKDDIRKCPRCQSVWWDTPKDGHAPEPVQVKPTPQPKAKPAPKADLTLFDAFWQQYPRKVAKQPALNAWKRIVNSEDQAHTIMKALAVQKICPQWTKDNGAFIPHPATWLNQHRWEDEAIPGQPMGILEPCTGRVRHQDDTRFVPCEKPGSFKWGMKLLCATCHEEALKNKASYEARLEGKA